jgi:uncharacterized protein YfaS (alpha-2-macroglobulin family)
VLAGWPANVNRRPEHVAPDQRFELLVAALSPDRKAIDLLLSTARVEFEPDCGAEPIPLVRTGERALSEEDPWVFRVFAYYREPWRAHREALKVFTLEPARPMPRDCSGALAVRRNVDSPDAPVHRWPLKTYGEFRLVSVRCGTARYCPVGPAEIKFSTPVRGSEVMRHVTVAPGVEFTIADTLRERATWLLDAELEPRTAYAVIIDEGLRDVFGQSLVGSRVAGFKTTGYAPTVSYPTGRWLVERRGPRTLAVQHVNVDTLDVAIAPVPDSLEGEFLSLQRWQWGDLWDRVADGAAHRKIPVRGPPDQRLVTGVRLPATDARRPGGASLLAVKVTGPGAPEGSGWGEPIALVQVTDLAVHTRFGRDGGAVWVTGVGDGAPRAGVTVTIYDDEGKALAEAQTDDEGLARFPGLKLESTGGWGDQLKGYAAARLGEDRAVVPLSSWELSPWAFRVRRAYGAERRLRAGAVFTERGIYRPGEPVFAKAIVRRGPLGDLSVPPVGDSLHWVFLDRQREVLKDTVVALSAFGTAHQKFPLATELPLGHYWIEVQMKERGRWETVARARYRVAEYRPPEFLVDVTVPDERQRYAGDTARVSFDARYLFGAPMGRAAVTWVARQRTIRPRELDIPNTAGYYLGERGRWWDYRDVPPEAVIAEGADSLDMSGHLDVALELPRPPQGRPARATFEATVTDVNRQTVSASTSVIVHPAAFYIGAKMEGRGYFWRAGEPVTVRLIAVRPNGDRVREVSVSGTIVRREWHQVRRERAGQAVVVGEWVSDTVATCAVVTAAEPVPCRFTPPAGGIYVATFRATDAEGRPATTSFYRWATGRDWVPWYDESRFRMDVVPDRDRYSVGDTASVLLASPFVDAEAWVAVEREGIIEQRRLRIEAGATTVKLPITEKYVPNAYVSVIVVRGRTEPPGPPDDPGRPSLRVGYAELRVTPESKRLSVEVRPLQKMYRPGDTARVALRVRDAAGRGRRAEVTLWAVDEGVLALTGYETPDPLDLIYRERGLGVELSSNLVAVAEQLELAGTRAKGAPGGGGGMDVTGILRSEFRLTAFFLGSVVTDENGEAIAEAKLPDNLTTFRVMAVAVTEGDRYGRGAAELLVTRPLLARPALPRFLRAGDEFNAGVVVNHRLGETPTVKVEAEAEGVELVGRSTRAVALEPGRGSEVRFAYRGVDGDSATFSFKVSGGGEADAVQRRLAIRPPYRPRAHTIAGVLHDRAQVDFALPAGIDRDRSRLELSYAASALAVIEGIGRRMRFYPYYCTEQVASAALPLIALYRARRAHGDSTVDRDLAAEIAEAVDVISGRQGADGAIGFWQAGDWSNPWLSAYAGRLLLEARDVGIEVSDTVLARLADYLTATIRKRGSVRSPLVVYYRASPRLALADAVAAVDYLRRLGQPDVATENELYRQAGQLAWEDRVRLAEVLASRPGGMARRLLERAWDDASVEGRRATLPESVLSRDFYFPSSVRPTARLLMATLAVEPDHPLVAPLAEALAQQTRGRRAYYYATTQDYAFAALALGRYEEVRRAAAERRIRVAHGGRVLDEAVTNGLAARVVSLPLAGLLEDARGGNRRLGLTLAATEPGPPVFYYLTVWEVPLERPVRPGDQGIQVERWYERFEAPEPITEAALGDLVRVKLRITVPRERRFVVIDDALPAGLEAVDLSLRTVSSLPGAEEAGREIRESGDWFFGTWDYGHWSPFDHKEMRDDRVIYSATVLWPGTYYATYVARATTPGRFVLPPAHAEEMYNPGVNGRSGGGTFTVSEEGR